MKYIAIFIGLMIALTAGGVANAACNPSVDMCVPVPEKFDPFRTYTMQSPNTLSIKGKHNGHGWSSTTNNSQHFQGEDCSACHRSGGKAGSSIFTMSGTIYEDFNGKKPLADAEVILVNREGKVISMTTNSAGSFYTYENYSAPVSFYNSTTVKGGWAYKTWIKGNGGRIMPMSTLTGGKMSCTMHHGRLSTRGAAYTGGTVAPNAPISGINFRKHVKPIFLGKCTPCHTPGKPKTNTYFDQSAGRDLTTYAGITSSGTSGAKILTGGDPIILQKMRRHAGGKFVADSLAADKDYNTIRQWIADGAKDN